MHTSCNKAFDVTFLDIHALMYTQSWLVVSCCIEVIYMENCVTCARRSDLTGC